MRNEFLRDVIAGSAGLLVVLALIGLPKDPAPTQHVQVQWQGARLLPYFSPRGRAPVLVPRVGRSFPARPAP